MTAAIEIEIGASYPMEVDELVTFVTERERITLPVTASILAPDEHDGSQALRRRQREEASTTGAPTPRLLSTTLRDPELLKTVRLQPGQAALSKKFSTPRAEEEGGDSQSPSQSPTPRGAKPWEEDEEDSDVSD